MSEAPRAHERATRIIVQGVSGSGKTTLATSLAATFDVDHLELDSLYHQRDWTPLDLEEFRARVEKFVDQPSWIIDGNYSQVRDILWPRATQLVFIDLPRCVVMTRVIKRTILRIVMREQLWNGNRESWRNALSRDPARSIIVWTWNTHARYHREVPADARSALGDDKVMVLRSAREVRRFLDRVNSRD